MISYNIYMSLNETIHYTGVLGLQKASANLTQSLLMSKRLTGEDIKVAKEQSELKAVDVILKNRQPERIKEIKTELKSITSDLLRRARHYLQLTYELEEIEKSL